MVRSASRKAACEDSSINRPRRSFSCSEDSDFTSVVALCFSGLGFDLALAFSARSKNDNNTKIGRNDLNNKHMEIDLPLEDMSRLCGVSRQIISPTVRRR